MRTELYSVIKSPYLTEKVSTLMGEANQYAFKVDSNATKLQIKKAVEGYFSVPWCSDVHWLCKLLLVDGLNQH